MRALRPDKLTLGALEATLALYRDPRSALRTIPVLDMVSTGAAALKPRAHALARQLAKALGRGFQVRAQEDESEVGGGALPLQTLPTWVVQVRRREGGVSRLEARLRAHRPPVIARVKEDALVFDLRTLREGEDRIVMAALAAAREPRDAGADDVS
jgi:L-seryl-tRNA(Ser) seleniumtransferase